MKTLITFFCCFVLIQQAKADNKILFYFNHPVDTTVAKEAKAVYLNHCLADTFVAYINRAKYTIDINFITAKE